jgi:hypothetical protein
MTKKKRQQRQKEKFSKGTSLEKNWITEGAQNKFLKVREELGLVKDKETPRFLITTKGTDAQKSGQMHEYQNRWLHMKKFFLLMGDDLSALLCDREVCPDQPLPMDPMNVCNYTSYMCLRDGTRVCDPTNQNPIKDRLGHDVLAIGVWNAPNNVNKCQAAIKALHDLYPNLRGPYYPSCSVCVRLTNEYKCTARHTPCDLHSSGALLVKQGNVMFDSDVMKHFKAMRARLNSTHKEKGNIQLTPSEVRKLRTILLATSSHPNRTVALEGLKSYTMILLGIKQFLRSDELLEIQVDDFTSDLQIIRPEKGVEALVMKVCGKTDPVPLDLIIWADDEYPEFCPIRHLLLYVKLSGLKSGYLFPPEWTLPDASTGMSILPYDYDDFLAKMKVLCVEKLGRRSKDNIYGTHILRKTAYLFAIWGVLKVQKVQISESTDVPKLSMAAIMQSARHKAICNAATYARDSFGLYEWCRRTRLSDENEVSVWQDIHIENSEPFRATTVHCRAYQGELHVVADWYFSTYLGLCYDSKTSLHSYLEIALCAKGVESAGTLLVEKIKATAPPQQVPALLALLQKYRKEIRIEISPSPSLHDNDNDASEKKRTASEAHLLPPKTKPPKKPRAHGKDDMPGRHKISQQASVEEKAKLIVSLDEAYKDIDGTSNLTNGAKKALYTIVRPVATCIMLCHDGNPTNFAATVEALPTSKKYQCGDCASKK